MIRDGMGFFFFVCSGGPPRSYAPSPFSSWYILLFNGLVLARVMDWVGLWRDYVALAVLLGLEKEKEKQMELAYGVKDLMQCMSYGGPFSEGV